MSSHHRKRSRPDKVRAVPIHMSDIKHNSTCITLQLPLSLACHNCSHQLDILSFKRKKKRANQRQKHERNRCLQYWTNKWTQGTLSSAAHVATHNRTRDYLGIEKDVVLESINYYELNDSITNSSNKRKFNEDTTRCKKKVSCHRLIHQSLHL